MSDNESNHNHKITEIVQMIQHKFIDNNSALVEFIKQLQEIIDRSEEKRRKEEEKARRRQDLIEKKVEGGLDGNVRVERRIGGGRKKRQTLKNRSKRYKKSRKKSNRKSRTMRKY